MASLFFIVPAGGVGARMQADRPKQYLMLTESQSVLAATLSLLKSQGEHTIAVGISPDDGYFASLDLPKDLLRYDAGPNRSDTVRLGLQAIEHLAQNDDWVIVHDAARPGLTPKELQQFIHQVMTEPDSIGGIMALPAVDTVKQVNARQITQTIDRSTIHLAQTPQMFRYGVLKAAYEHALTHDLAVTDEASAVEALGHHPFVYQGYPHNFKITQPTDLRLMQFLFSERTLSE